MPLTNPNKVVTEERLSEFYGQILPYMGGMPDVLANKFSKGDLYSTDEKMIGQWTDGKPLYQKTVTTGGNVPSGATLIQRTTQTGYDTILYTKTTDSPISIGVDTDYSTDEKIVGTWIDGKPIYQCTFSKSISLPSSREYTNFEDLTSKNVDTVISMIGVWFDHNTTKQLGIGDTYPCNMTYDASNKYLRVLSTGINASTKITVTVKYTKTS